MEFVSIEFKVCIPYWLLKEEVYVDQPLGFIIQDEEDKVCKLNKALYGLKQAHIAWYDEADFYFTKVRFQKSFNEATLYTKTNENSGIIVVFLYIDNIVYTGGCPPMLEEFKSDMIKHYEMTNFRLLHHFLGMGIVQTKKSIFIHQKFGLKDCKLIGIPLAINDRLCKVDGSKAANEVEYRKIVRSLLYLTATRQDIMFVGSLISIFMHCLTKKLMRIAKWVLRYVQGTLDYGIEYIKGKTKLVIG